MSGKLYNAIQRTGGILPALQPIVNSFKDIAETERQKQALVDLHNLMSTFRSTVNNSQQNATTPGSPAQTFNIPYALANPNIPVPAEQPKPFTDNFTLDSMIGARRPQGGILNLSPAPGSATERRPDISVTTPARAATYNPQAQENTVNDAYVNFLSGIMGLQGGRPEDKQSAMQLAGMIQQINQPKYPTYKEVDQTKDQYMIDPNTREMKLIKSGTPKPDEILEKGIPSTQDYPELGIKKGDYIDVYRDRNTRMIHPIGKTNLTSQEIAKQRLGLERERINNAKEKDSNSKTADTSAQSQKIAQLTQRIQDINDFWVKDANGKFINEITDGENKGKMLYTDIKGNRIVDSGSAIEKTLKQDKAQLQSELQGAQAARDSKINRPVINKPQKGAQTKAPDVEANIKAYAKKWKISEDEARSYLK